MFPEHRQLIKALRQSDNHFASLYDQHTKLDDQIDKISTNQISLINTSTTELTELKRKKLQLKETLLELLNAAAKKAAS